MNELHRKMLNMLRAEGTPPQLACDFLAACFKVSDAEAQGIMTEYCKQIPPKKWWQGIFA